MFRIIAHLDLDCFYCQVEHKRLGIPREEPLAVQQWDSVIAVNYAARASPYSIKRGMKAEECKRRCPEIHLIHVELIGEVTAHDAHNQRSHTKVSLKRYRLASMEIMSILNRLCPNCERASIDEAYLDITEDAKSTKQYPYSEDLSPEHFTNIDGTVLQPQSPHEVMLHNAAAFVHYVRSTVLKETSYTISAGIATNKLIAKQASACRKPNKQTIVPLSSLDTLMRELDIQDIRGLGGKLGEQLIKFSKMTKAVELQAYTEQQLVQEFGDRTGPWIYKICRGIDDEPVKPNLKPKSLLAFKSFRSVVSAIITNNLNMSTRCNAEIL